MTGAAPAQHDEVPHDEPRLTSLAHGGGCGCKLSPGMLDTILKKLPLGPAPTQLLVGRETGDDAAVYLVRPDLAIVATVDFFTPIVDNPRDFGRIAASNALSDVYAMGAEPLFALALVGMPIGRLSPETIGKILAGGEEGCGLAEIPVVGGHSIDSQEPIYGLAVIGSAHPDRIRRNADALDGDALILGKPLGIGVLSAALKKGALSEAGYATMLRWTTLLNRPGPQLAERPEVHAMTDVTGFGLLGHLLEVCRASNLAAEISVGATPILPVARDLAAAGFATGASQRNWDSFGHAIAWPDELSDLDRALLCDPQTSGGLLVSCAPEAAPDVIKLFKQAGFGDAAIIGRLMAGGPGITVRA